MSNTTRTDALSQLLETLDELIDDALKKSKPIGLTLSRARYTITNQYDRICEILAFLEQTKRERDEARGEAKIVNGDTSDGYHTFNELYEHRCTLFLALMASNPNMSWASAKHFDGSDFDGWFVAGMELPTGDVTYHLPDSMWEMAKKTGACIMDRGKEWDGHRAADVIERIQKWVKEGAK
jgi:hypothetical protein